MNDPQIDHFRKLERMYLKANFNLHLYPTTTCEISDREATISMEVSPKYFHALGAIHGSIYFKILDDAAFFAVNSIVRDVFVLTTSFNINIVRPVNKGLIKAVGKVKFNSRRLFVAESQAFDEKGNLIAFGTGQFMKSAVELDEKIGYRL